MNKFVRMLNSIFRLITVNMGSSKEEYLVYSNCCGIYTRKKMKLKESLGTCSKKVFNFFQKSLYIVKKALYNDNAIKNNSLRVERKKDERN